MGLGQRLNQDGMFEASRPSSSKNAPVVGQIASLSDGGLNQIGLNIVARLGEEVADAWHDHVAHFHGEVVNSKRFVEVLPR